MIASILAGIAAGILSSAWGLSIWQGLAIYGFYVIGRIVELAAHDLRDAE